MTDRSILSNFAGVLIGRYKEKHTERSSHLLSETKNPTAPISSGSSSYYILHKTLNIPHKLMKCFRRDKSGWELLIFALCIKMHEGSSAIHPEVSEIRKLLNCSYYKAVRLIEGAKRCPYLFRYYPEANLLIARSFTRGRLEKSEYACGRKSFTAYHADCFKFRYDSGERISHIGISRQLRDALIKHAIMARQLRNDFNTVVPTERKPSTRSNRSTALLTVKLGRISGYHHSTVSRHIRRMEEREEVRIYRPGYIPVSDLRTGELLTDDESLLSRRAFPHRGLLVVRDANEYVIDAKSAPVYCHVIFNHARRHRRNVDNSARRPFNEQWMDFINR